MQYVLLKSGVLIRFHNENCPFEFNDKRYFSGDVGIKLPNSNPERDFFHKVESFTFHYDEMSCHWVE